MSLPRYEYSFIEQVRRSILAIRRAFINTCDNPAVFYVETIAPFAGRALLTLLMFDMNDIMRGYFRPRTARSGRHGRRGRRGGGRGFGLPEPGERIAKSIPGQRTLYQRQVSDGVRHLWIIDNTLQKASFFWMLADVIGDFVVGATTAILTEEALNCDSGFYVLMTGPGGWAAADVQAKLPVPDTKIARGPVSVGAGEIGIGAQIAEVIVQNTLLNGLDITPGAGRTRIGIRVQKGSSITFHWGGWKNVAEGNTADLIYSRTELGPALIQGMTQSQNMIGFGESSTLIATGF